MTSQLDFDSTSRTIEAGGYRLHYHEAGEGPALVLLHGSGPGVSAWSNFRGNLPVFAQHFRTILLDMPGFGRSEPTKLDRFYPAIAVDVVCALLDELGIERASVLGNSMGGQVAAAFGQLHPERAHRLVMMGPAGLAVNPFAPELSAGMMSMGRFMGDPTRERLLEWFDFMVEEKSVINDGLVEERLANATKPGAIEQLLAVYDTWEKYDDSTVGHWSQAHLITTPTLITWGRDDRMLPFEGAFLAFRRMPNAELHLFPNCGHWAQVERKDEFERVVIEFLTRA